MIKPHIGGGFGARTETLQSDLIAALLARKAKSTVKVVLSREETFLTHRGRPEPLPLLVQPRKILRARSTAASDGRRGTAGGTKGRRRAGVQERQGAGRRDQTRHCRREDGEVSRAEAKAGGG